MMLQAAITSDIDTLASIYRGRGCTRPGGYSYAELHIGLESFARFLEPYRIKATLFMVGEDFQPTGNHAPIRAAAAAGHEIANHSLTHAQGFRLLPEAAKEAEIAGMEDLCAEVTGRRPVGFRSPGWNMGDDAADILRRRGYIYDSSVHPTSLMPLLKFLHWKSTSSRSGGDRTTMGHLHYMFAPTTPYRCSQSSLGRRGCSDLLEFPVTVTPVLRLPFFATFLLATGLPLFKRSLRALIAAGRPIQFMFHLSDFVDYTHREFADQLPSGGGGVYIPRALQLPLAQKTDIFRRAVDLLTETCSFSTLEQQARQMMEEPPA
jgi:hypothetical protein